MKSLRINFILPRGTLSGGVNVTRLIGEAMVRRGQTVNLVFSTAPKRWPRPWQIRRLSRRSRLAIRLLGKERHHLQNSTTNLVPIRHYPVTSDDVPDADVTIATWWETVEWIAKWPASKGVKVHFVQGHEVYSKNPNRVKQVYRLPYLKLVISRWLQRVMVEEYGSTNAVLVPNGVDRDQFGATERPKASVPTVGLVFCPAAIKGADTAFDAIRRVQQELPELRVVCFGTMAIERRRIAPRNLEFHCRPPQSVIPELYRSVDCWLLPSTTEGFGMPGLEAAACRCPVVATRCGGPEDYVEDGVNGYLVPVGDPRAMSEAILRVVTLDEDRWKAMSDASHAIAKRFDWDRSAKILERALLRAVQEHESQNGARRDSAVTI